MSESLAERLAAPVPRYTSYPSAPHFSTQVGAGVYGDWLGALKPGSSLSLYLHIPFCDRLCWFCACHTKQTQRYDPVEAYLVGLFREIALVSARLPAGVTVTEIHLGGGSPTMLTPDDMLALKERLDEAFTLAPDCRISVEMDPNDLDAARHDALAAIGLTRASLGIQDFDPTVQAAINRHQTFEQTREAIAASRARGVGSVNCDVLYGLPHQTLASLQQTVEHIVSLRPDRIALFGYAHVPWMKKHQTMIPDATLPSVTERFRQMQHAAAMLADAGYQAIGIDHFALPEDSLAAAHREGRLKRNFQGYTDDAADALIGLGASSIGQLPQGYVQNMPATGEYLRQVAGGGLPVVRGYALSADDRMRAHVIERLMCDFSVDLADLATRFAAGEAMADEMRRSAAADGDRLSVVDGDSFRLTAAGQPFARTVAARFDAYLSNGKGRHSIAV
ncbi:coproporphyrinogen III oxidase, anaerobic [Rhizobium sp. RU20A]|uniref:oxygen-independent coproporphyrinogen III oxidase n=1 Tax=Rhizobium sp. RU20A TaxID=1907412 RepID=UPI000956A4B1|nr:oxygen-independent coproporphyrinogen III oxidase [Rhizobium sp. RU20A]SIQ15846.1 coproporphyrinogen III oxidase, anaerobic [Rhizobium sp. RU20A]